MDADRSLHETCFKTRWNRFARANQLPDDPAAAVPVANVAELRRAALEFFSWGLVHEAATTRRLKELKLGDEQQKRRRCSNKVL